MRTEADLRERLASTREELAALQKEYRDLTATEGVQYQGIDTDTIALEGTMAPLRAAIRALEWVLATDDRNAATVTRGMAQEGWEVPRVGPPQHRAILVRSQSRLDQNSTAGLVLLPPHH